MKFEKSGREVSNAAIHIAFERAHRLSIRTSGMVQNHVLGSGNEKESCGSVTFGSVSDDVIDQDMVATVEQTAADTNTVPVYTR